jgi:hypothetical protein
LEKLMLRDLGGCFAAWLESAHCHDRGSWRVLGLLH